MSTLPPKELHTHCPDCHLELPPTRRVCSSCGFDRGAYLAAESVSGPALQSARCWILGAAILMTISALARYFQVSEVVDALVDRELASRLMTMLVVPTAAVSLSFYGLWLWACKQPLAASVAALVLYLLLLVTGFVFAPETLLDGLLLKGALAAVLIGGVRAGFEAKRVRLEYARENPPLPA